MKSLLYTSVITLLASSASQAAIVAMGDTFSTDTKANYSATGGYSLSYVSSSSTDFGDGADEGALSISVLASNNTGFLDYNIGLIELADVGKDLTLTFRVDGTSANFHSDIVSFTLGGTAIASTSINTNPDFIEWNTAGTAPADPAATLADWRNKNGVGVLSYTIQAGDVGNNLGWQFDSAGTSSGGFSFRIDNWDLNASPVPEPSSTALIGLAGLGIILRRRRA